jgi:hypothetical protein
MRADLRMVAHDLLAPDRIEQNNALAARVSRLTCEVCILHGRSAWPFVRMLGQIAANRQAGEIGGLTPWSRADRAT